MTARRGREWKNLYLNAFDFGTNSIKNKFKIVNIHDSTFDCYYVY